MKKRVNKFFPQTTATTLVFSSVFILLLDREATAGEHPGQPGEACQGGGLHQPHLRAQGERGQAGVRLLVSQQHHDQLSG